MVMSPTNTNADENGTPVCATEQQQRATARRRRRSTNTRSHRRGFVVATLLLLTALFLRQLVYFKTVHNDKDGVEETMEELLLWSARPSVSSNGGDVTKKNQQLQQQGPLLIYPDNNHVSPSCVCDLVSVDCLHVLKCGEYSYTNTTLRQDQEIQASLTRTLLKHSSNIYKYSSHDLSWAPVGKTLQYSAIDMYQGWKMHNRLSLNLHNETSIFCNHTWYQECREKNILGKACYFENVNLNPDDERDGRSTRSYDTNIQRQATATVADLQHIRQSSSSHTAPPFTTLLAFAQLLRIRFTLRQFMHDIYQQRLVKIVHHNDTNSYNNLRVSLHLRRADACDHAQDGYELEPSVLDSPAQTSGKRKCYHTSVYMNALERVLKTTSSVDVYLSTDHASSLIFEIQRDYAALYQSCNWYYLNYSNESTFQYQGMIEIDADSQKQPLLGESAVADLHHISHGQVFIGHLGSRFGKMGYLLMTARYSRFVPFYSPDGHSLCCEIDEDCGQVKPYITDMENCLTFSHELSPLPMNKGVNNGYWDVGSKKREAHYYKEMEKKQQVKE